MSKLRLPQIDAGDHKLSRVSEKAWAAISKANEPPYLFRFGNVPHRLEHDDDDVIVVRKLTQDRLCHTLARVADWFQIKDGKSFPAIPPVPVIKDMLAEPDPPLPILHRVVQVPVFAPDGTLQTAPGYHSAARVYYAPPKGLTIDDVPANPTPDDITQARRLILEHVLEGFPFVSDSDRAHAVALILLLYARDLIKGQTPLHSVESALAGTGKGLLVDVSLRPVLGPRIGVIVQTNSEDEWRKRITAALMESPGPSSSTTSKSPWPRERWRRF